MLLADENPNMPKPLPLELRSRVVNAYNDGEGSVREIAQRFCVCARSIFRWLALERCSNDLSPKQARKGPAPKISEKSFDELNDFCMRKPDRTVAELAQDWSKEKDQPISRSSMGRALLRAGLSLKKRLSDQPNVNVMM